ncbi:unnamed protein product [Moneuplotes crassus]|uniref:Uncharacterized protein n=1 Tax=Euplotes crassus TaxID=5936 RepID=A0AAD1U6M3_EUPCR|nr:unnamed protein product [Moneuplotes crassus]
MSQSKSHLPESPSKKHRKTKSTAFTGLNIDKRKDFKLLYNLSVKNLEQSRVSLATASRKSVACKSIKPKKAQAKEDPYKRVLLKFFKYKDQELEEYQKKAEELHSLKMQEKSRLEQEKIEEELRQQKLLEEKKVKEERNSKINLDFSQKVYYNGKDPQSFKIRQAMQQIDQEKEDLAFERFNQGDLRVFEAQDSRYHLSKTEKLDFSDKFTGEQNRAVYQQVRPSYYNEHKQDQILGKFVSKLADAEWNQEKFSKHFKKPKHHKNTNGFGWENTLRKEDGFEEIRRYETSAVKAAKDDVESHKYSQELYSYIDPTRFRNIQKIFEHYCTLGRSDNFSGMDTSQLQSFLKDNELYFKNFGPADADIYFSQGNTSKFINFK